jgi:hypothetical protein
MAVVAVIKLYYGTGEAQGRKERNRAYATYDTNNMMSDGRHLPVMANKWLLYVSAGSDISYSKEKASILLVKSPVDLESASLSQVTVAPGEYQLKLLPSHARVTVKIPRTASTCSGSSNKEQ